MQYAVEIGTNRLLKADGTEVGTADTDRPTLHLLPELLMPVGCPVDLSEVRLEVFCDPELEMKLLPQSGIKVRRPYPNPRYLIGGSEESRNGWCVDATDLPRELPIEFRWTITGATAVACAGTPLWVVRHVLAISLEEGSHRTYTMSVSDWPRGGAPAAPIYRSAIAMPRASHFTEKYKHREIWLAEEVDHTSFCDGSGLLIREGLTIPPIPFEQATSINAHQDLQLHEMDRQSTFETGNAEHYALAQVQIPPEVLIKAICLAQTLPFDIQEMDDGLDHTGYLENHPAMQVLRDWWETNRPQCDNSLPFGFVMPYVRVTEAGDYLCGYREVPDASLEVMQGLEETSASCGDAIILQFMASQRLHKYDEHDCLTIQFANGQEASTVGVSRQDVMSGRYDEAWYSLQALAMLPSNFPEAYAALEQKATLSAD